MYDFPLAPIHNQTDRGIAPTYHQYDAGIAHTDGESHYDRSIVRTPSPTPSEQRALSGKLFDWNDLKTNWRKRVNKKNILYLVVLLPFIGLVIFESFNSHKLVNSLTPLSLRLRHLTLGWLIPVAILFVISFPPLFGHEIIAVLCGVVWGLGTGFAIVALGTLLGEVGNFYAFKYLFRNRAVKLEREKLTYACLAKVVRTRGFKVVLAARLSVIPPHFTTAIFATCGLNIIVFLAAAILSLPKQLSTVSLGVVLGNSGTESKQNKIVTDTVLVVTILVTGFAMWYILRAINQVKPDVIHERQKRRKLEEMQKRGLNISEELSTSIDSSPTLRESHDDIELEAATLDGGSVYQPKPTRPNDHDVLQKPRDSDVHTDSGAGTLRTSAASGVYHDESASDSDLGRPPMQHALPRRHSPASTSSSPRLYSSYSSRPDQYVAGARYAQGEALEQHDISSQRSSPPHAVRSTTNLLADNEWVNVAAASYATDRSDFTPSSSPPPLPSRSSPSSRPGRRSRPGQV